MSWNAWLSLGALLAGISVGMGAFAAHGLKGRLDSEMLAVFETGARYQMYHALGMLAVGLLLSRADNAWVQTAGWAFLVGILLFSGSLYALPLSGVRWLGAITPFGGVAFLIGWVALAVAAWRAGRV